jgi:hypothetical protein
VKKYRGTHLSTVRLIQLRLDNYNVLTVQLLTILSELAYSFHIILCTLSSSMSLGMTYTTYYWRADSSDTARRCQSQHIHWVASLKGLSFEIWHTDFITSFDSSFIKELSHGHEKSCKLAAIVVFAKNSSARANTNVVTCTDHSYDPLFMFSVLHY